MVKSENEKDMLQRLFTFLMIMASVITINNSLYSQDSHYSQFDGSPVLLNPALQGHISGGYRMVLMHRNQWASVLNSGGFATPSIALDMNIDWFTRNSIGVGAGFINDRTPGGNMTRNTSFAGFAFHLNVDPNRKHYLSIGYQHGFINTRINATNLLFESDLLGGEKEVFTNTSVTNGESRIGAAWTSYLNDKYSFMIGGAFIHTGGFTEKFISLVSTTPTKLVFHGELEYNILEKFQIKPYFLYMRQGTFEQTVGGVQGQLNMNLGTKVFAGVGYRTSDAMIITGGLELIESIRLGVSYDINTSPLNAATNGNGAFEISLQYIGQIARSFKEVEPRIRY